MLGEKKRKRGEIKMIAQMLQVTPRTIRNWIKSSNSEILKIGRPRYTIKQRKQSLILVARELKRQGYPGSPAVAKVLGERVPRRLVIEYVKKIKMRRRRYFEIEKQKRRIKVEVLMKNAIWTQDGTHIGRLRNKSIEAQIVKDRGSLKTLAIQTGKAAKGKNVVDLFTDLKKCRELPLVWMTDNGSAYCNEEVDRFLEEEKIIHLKSLPRTPQHNGSSEIGIKEIKKCAELGTGYVLDSEEEGHAKLIKASDALNERLRASKGFINANKLDEILNSLCNNVKRDEFYTECKVELNLVSKSLSWREKRLAEREVIFRKLEEYGAIKKTRGCGTNA